MGPVLYLAPASPPCRAVLMTAKAIDLSLQEEVIDFQKGDHRKPEYLKVLNQVPVRRKYLFYIFLVKSPTYSTYFGGR